jgi:hypothetical protein
MYALIAIQAGLPKKLVRKLSHSLNVLFYFITHCIDIILSLYKHRGTEGSLVTCVASCQPNHGQTADASVLELHAVTAAVLWPAEQQPVSSQPQQPKHHPTAEAVVNHLTTRPPSPSRPASPPTSPTTWSSLTCPTASPSSRLVQTRAVIPNSWGLSPSVSLPAVSSMWRTRRTVPCSVPGTRWTRTLGLGRRSVWSRSPPLEEAWGHSRSAQRTAEQLVRGTETCVHISIYFSTASPNTVC